MEVILVAAVPQTGDTERFFVEISGVPHARGSLVVTRALPKAQAEKVKRDIEDSLDTYRRPRRASRRRAKTIWERLKDA